MRPDCVSACVGFGARHVEYMVGQKDGREDRYDLKASQRVIGLARYIIEVEKC